MNDNTELLKFAAENIEEWPEEWTHLRSDKCTRCFYTCGDKWRIESEGYYWVESKCFNQLDKEMSTDTPQVISKEEWEEGRKENDKSKPEDSVTPLQIGTYLVKREDYEDFCKDADAGGVKIFSSLWSEWMGKFPSDDEIIVYYGTAAFGTLGWDKLKNCTKPFVEYKPKSTCKTENSNTFTKSMLEVGKHVVLVKYKTGSCYFVWLAEGLAFDMQSFYGVLQEDINFDDVERVYEVGLSSYGQNLKLVWSREDEEKESKRKKLEEEVKKLEQELKLKKEEMEGLK